MVAAALAIDPAHELSQRAWGLILLRHGNLVAALEHLVEATRIHPEFGAALQDIARIAERLWPMAGSVTPRSASAPRSPTPEEYPCT